MPAIRRTGGAAALVAVLALTACAGGPADGGAPSATPSATTAAFPVTIDTVYGKLTVNEKPQRIVATSGAYIDMLNAIGLKPVASAAAVKDKAELNTVMPWLAGLETGEFDVALNTAEGTALVEAIAKYQPDLILMDTWEADEVLYKRLSQLAPTFAGTSAGNNDWNVTMKAVGELTGEKDATEAAFARVDTAYAKVRERVPALKGKTYNALRSDGDAGFGIGNGSWFEGFGLVPAKNQVNSQKAGNISLENMSSDLTADVTSIWFYKGSYRELAADPRFAKLPSAVNRTVIDVDLPLAHATNGAGPSSILYAIDRVGPILEKSALADK